MAKPRKIIIFDTTLRDGEQSPGASLNLREKVQIAKQLGRLRVDVIEAGFPIASPGDFEAVRAVASEVKKPVVAALARCSRKDIDRAAEALKPAGKPRIHVFLATSKIHRDYKLRMTSGEVLRRASSMVKYAKRYVDDVEFSPEDASRTEIEFLAKVVEAVIASGATTVNIPDTVGYSTPEEFAGVIRYLKENVSNIGEAVLSVHCHNDLGLAVANSLAAVVAGAEQVECTINGLGERAGNASLEEIVMALATRSDIFGFRTSVNTKQITRTSRLVSHLTGIVVQPNKAIVGENAFAHEAGIHQDGILKKRKTYEIMKPQDIGLGESRLVLGKHSGRHAFKERLKQMGYELKEAEVERAFGRFKELADKKKAVFDEDIGAIIEDEIYAGPEKYRLEYISISSGNRTVPTATVRLRCGDDILQDAACGDGPVDAALKTIDRITRVRGRLIDYSLRSVTGGKDAMGEVTVRINVGRECVTGRGSSTDIIEASAKAYLNGINKIVWRKKRSAGKKETPSL
ncbi:MAG: 2-isopropylmalate synthase [Candidatus Tritonobacter lacicola]|nr:2-isopropylmalate synthase [Candidatus Tritonobacter lacicola]